MQNCFFIKDIWIQTGGRFFGAELNTLVDDEQAIPVVINKLFVAIELRALFVEGIYRKSAAIAQVRNARRTIETAPSKRISLYAFYCFAELTTNCLDVRCTPSVCPFLSSSLR